MSVQIVSGILITFYYRTASRFSSLWEITLLCNLRRIVHFTHRNLPTLIFTLLYLHILKALLFESYINNFFTWTRGVAIFFVLVITSFSGYVLPWGQISLWGATVITNLLSVIPFIGEWVVIWIWGGFFISAYTVNFILTVHFILPFCVAFLIVLHIFAH